MSKIDDERKLAEARAAQKEASQDFISRFNDLSVLGVTSVDSLDTNKTEDRILAVQTLLRGKTKEQYHDIFSGLTMAMREAEKEEKEEEKEFLISLMNTVYILGEINLNIDWH